VTLLKGILQHIVVQIEDNDDNPFNIQENYPNKKIQISFHWEQLRQVEKSGHPIAIFLNRKRRCHNEENSTRRYSKEFREEAVKLVVVQDLSVPKK
jgi:hypothetical protein